MKNVYLQFLQLLHSIDSDLDWGLDQASLHLLDVIAVHHSNKEPLTVTAAMQLNAIASPASIHRKISSLCELDLIHFEYKNGNRRTKYLAPSKLAKQRYEKLAQALLDLKKS
jgi:hypothetical protein